MLLKLKLSVPLNLCQYFIAIALPMTLPRSIYLCNYEIATTSWVSGSTEAMEQDSLGSGVFLGNHIHMKIKIQNKSCQMK